MRHSEMRPEREEAEEEFVIALGRLRPPSAAFGVYREKLVVKLARPRMCVSST